MLRIQQYFPDSSDIVNLPVHRFPNQFDTLRRGYFFGQKSVEIRKFSSAQIDQIDLCLHFNRSHQTFSHIQATPTDLDFNEQVIVIDRSIGIRLHRPVCRRLITV